MIGEPTGICKMSLNASICKFVYGIKPQGCRRCLSGPKAVLVTYNAWLVYYCLSAEDLRCNQVVCGSIYMCVYMVGMLSRPQRYRCTDLAGATGQPQTDNVHACGPITPLFRSPFCRTRSTFRTTLAHILP